MVLHGALLVALGALGALDALYFVLVTYRWMRPDPRWLPRACRMDEASCARVVDTPEARVLGVPNAVVGLAWYLVVVAAGAWALGRGEVPLCPAVLAASGASVLLSAALAWALLARLRVRCALCFLGHALNGAILLVLAGACLT